MTQSELYILTERKKKLLQLIAEQFSLKKHERGDIADLHNRLSWVKECLKEPVIRMDKPVAPLPMPAPEYNSDTMLTILYPLEISNTCFRSHIGIVKVSNY